MDGIDIEDYTFRTLQAANDLRLAALGVPSTTFDRLLAGTESGHSAELVGVLRGGAGVLDSTQAQIYLPALQLAATLPDDDYDAFFVATAILLIDRLTVAMGQDDLFWHWDAFQDHYLLSPAAKRAAVLGGFRQLQMDGRVDLHEPPDGEGLLTYKRDEVLQILSKDGGVTREEAQKWMTEAARFGTGNENHPGPFPVPPAALRYAYEYDPRWTLCPTRRFALGDMTLDLLPWEDVVT